MEEKEAIRLVRESFSGKKTRADITREFQKKGYKLEYINAIIKKAKRPKKLIVNLSIFFVLIVSLTLFISSIYLFNQKEILENPLGSYNLQVNSTNNLGNLAEEELGQIEITPEFLNYLLNELGAWKLHKNPLNFEKPFIDFEISGKKYTSIIGNEIETKEGSNENADIKFIFKKEDIISAILSENTLGYIKEKFETEEASIEPLTDDKELFVKGYLSLYNSLSE